MPAQLRRQRGEPFERGGISPVSELEHGQREYRQCDAGRMPFRATVYRLGGQRDAGFLVAGHRGDPGDDSAKIRRRMQLAGVLCDLDTLVRGSQRIMQPPRHERRLGVLQQDVR